MKTPLAIIQSNNDTMALIHGENKYNVHIRNQTKRLNVLMTNLLTLAKLDEEIPDVISDLKAQGDILMNIYNNLIEILGGDGEQTAIVYNAISVLYDMAEDPDEIATLFNSFKNQITNLGSWLSTMRNQPLELDYILVAQPDYVPGDAESNIFEDIWHNIEMFLASFTSDTNAIGATSEKTFDTTVSVWASTGKERAEIKQRLIERAFINQYGIGVDIKLVPGRKIEKNPVITVLAGSEKCYLFVKVEDGLNGVATIDWTAGDWSLVEGTTNIYCYKEVVDASASAVKVDVFKSITCTSTIEKYTTAGEIKITAYAIQAEGFNGNVKNAWTAGGFN